MFLLLLYCNTEGLQDRDSENPLWRWLFDRSSNFRLKNSHRQQQQYRERAGELTPQLHSVSSLWSPAGAPHRPNPAGRWEIPLTVPTAQGRGRRGENECEKGNRTTHPLSPQYRRHTIPICYLIIELPCANGKGSPAHSFRWSVLHEPQSEEDGGKPITELQRP